MKNLILGLFLFVNMSGATLASTTINCSHAELCKLVNIILSENKITDILTFTLVNISGDPHEYEPSSAEIKSLINAPLLITGPSELNPWIKKINLQRSKLVELKTISLLFNEADYKLYPRANSEVLSHFWIYPKVFCSLKERLEIELKKMNHKISKHECSSSNVEEKLKTALSKIKTPIILTHDALLPLLLYLDKNPRPIVAIKGSGHHEEASSESIKKMYDALKAPKVLWVEEIGINIPQNIRNKIRTVDIIIKIDTANSQASSAFSVLLDLTEKLNSMAISL